jgi:hypothetical protein
LAAERLAGCRPMGRLNDCSYLGVLIFNNKPF